MRVGFVSVSVHVSLTRPFNMNINWCIGLRNLANKNLLLTMFSLLLILFLRWILLLTSLPGINRTEDDLRAVHGKHVKNIVGADNRFESEAFV